MIKITNKKGEYFNGFVSSHIKGTLISSQRPTFGGIVGSKSYFTVKAAQDDLNKIKSLISIELKMLIFN